MLTWERNLLTLLLGGWLTLPGRFLPRSWNLSVIFLWGWVDLLNVVDEEKDNKGGILAQKTFLSKLKTNNVASVSRRWAVCISASKEPPAKVGRQNMERGREIDRAKKAI